MREGWELRKLGDLTSVITKGTTPTSVGFKFKNEGINFVKVESLSQNGDFIEDKLAFISDDANKALKRSQLEEGDILFSIAGALGRTAIVTEDILPANTNQALSIIRLKPNPNISLKYVYSTLTSGYALEQIEKYKGGVAQQNLSLTQMKSFQIPIPPIQEQQQIVTILDKAFEAIEQAKANIEKNIRNAKELFQSRLNDIFNQKGEGWEQRNLGKACEISMGQSPKGTSYNSEGIGTPLINGPVEFGPKPFSKTVMTKWTTEPRKLCKEGDLILCVRGSTTGRINIAGFDACIGRGVASIRYNKNQEWINFFIRCNQKNIYDLGTGSTFPNVSGKILSGLMFSEPKSIEIQNSLIHLMKQLELDCNQIIKNYTQKISNLEELKKSILQKAFAGELTNKTVEV